MRNAKGFISGVALLCSLVLFGCGGGSSDGGTTTGIAYEGLTSAAALTQVNAQEITLDAMDGGEIGSIAGGGADLLALNANRGADGISIGPRDVSSLISRIDTFVSTLELESLPPSVAAATEPISEVGPCGGSLSGSATINESSGAVSATVTFANYRDYDSGSFDSCSAGSGDLLNGTLSVSISSQQTDASISFTFSAFTLAGDDNDISLSGVAQLDLSGIDQGRITLDLVARDNSSGEMFKVENFILVGSDFGTYQTEEISGRFYNAEYGYVDIETITPVETALDSEWPHAGVVRFTGSAGSVVTLSFAGTSVTGSGTDSQGGAISFEYVYPLN